MNNKNDKVIENTLNVDAEGMQIAMVVRALVKSNLSLQKDNKRLKQQRNTAVRHLTEKGKTK